MNINDATATARNDDPRTSHAAAQKINANPQRLAEVKFQILFTFFMLDKKSGASGGTDEDMRKEYQRRYGEILVSSFAKRRKDLVELGYIEDSGVTFINSRNHSMIVWEITEKGKEYIQSRNLGV